MKVDPADLALWRDTVRAGLSAFVEQTMTRHLGADWRARDSKIRSGTLDTHALLSVMIRNWGPIFSQHLARTERSHADLALQFRNRMAHEQEISDDDLTHALDIGARLLSAIGAEAESNRLESRRDALLSKRYAAAPIKTPGHEPKAKGQAESSREKVMSVTAEQRAAYQSNPDNKIWKQWVDDRVCVDGKMDLERLYSLAREYGITKRYDGLNPGQQRMNIGNQLRRRVPKELWSKS